MVPFTVDAFDRFGLQPQSINLPRCAEHAGDDGNIEAFDVFEDQRRPLVRRDFLE